MGVIEVSLDGGVLDGPVHAFDLPVGSRVVGLGEPVFYSMKVTDAVEGVATKACGWALTVLRQIGELDAVIGQRGVDAVRNSFNERVAEGDSGLHICFFHEFDHSELRSPIDDDQQIELAFGVPHLG
jgi:hypothetical protein